MNDQLKNDYKKIKAPDSLRQRVAEYTPQASKAPFFATSRFVKSVSAIAACFVFAAIVMITVLINGNDSVSIVVSGNTVGEDGAVINAIPVARNRVAPASVTDDVVVTFTLECKSESEISVSCGEIVDATDGYVDGDTVTWIVAEPVAQGAQLHVMCGNKTSTYTLCREDGTGVWTINKTK